MQTTIGYSALVDRPLSHGTPSRPLLGLPIARLIPQDVHSLFDYAGALALTAAGLLARSAPARVSATSLGVGSIGIALTTDYRLSAWKLIPIRVHEALDYAVGAIILATPFVLGYRKRDPLASAVQIAGGAGVLLISLFTDYRACRRDGRGSPRTAPPHISDVESASTEDRRAVRRLR